MTIERILTELKQGNQRFIEKKSREKSKQPKELEGGQSPHTIVISCADSRVPPELIFDQDLGELFVIRIAGNTATDEAIGSAEYAAANLGSALCLVMGHSKCGAVAATVDHVQNGTELPSHGLKKVVEPIVEPVKQSLEQSSGSVLEQAIKNNIEKTIVELQEKSSILKGLKDQGKLTFMGAKYDLGSGEVNFY